MTDNIAWVEEHKANFNTDDIKETLFYIAMNHPYFGMSTTDQAVTEDDKNLSVEDLAKYVSVVIVIFGNKLGDILPTMMQQIGMPSDYLDGVDMDDALRFANRTDIGAIAYTALNDENDALREKCMEMIEEWRNITNQEN